MIIAAINISGDLAAIGVIVTGIASITSTVFSYLARRQAVKNNKVGQETRTLARENKVAVQEVHEKVNGNLAKAVAKAEDQARKRTDPRVLIIDDDEDDIHFAKIVLERFGCTVYSALDAEAAEELLLKWIGSGRGYPFDFVLVDLKMPGGGTEEVFRMFAEKAERVPLVVLTGQLLGTLDEKIANLPRFWLKKPLTDVQVQSLLDQLSVPYHIKQLPNEKTAIAAPRLADSLDSCAP